MLPQMSSVTNWIRVTIARLTIYFVSSQGLGLSANGCGGKLASSGIYLKFLRKVRSSCSPWPCFFYGVFMLPSEIRPKTSMLTLREGLFLAEPGGMNGSWLLSMAEISESERSKRGTSAAKFKYGGLAWRFMDTIFKGRESDVPLD